MINEALATLDDISHWAPTGSCNSLQMLRLDKLHPVVSGNKWYKLKYNAEEAKAQGKETLLTFGGGYSNHLVATAYAAREWGLHSIGLVRGHYTGAHFTDTLRQCEAYGMQLVPVSKSEYVVAQSSEDLASKYPEALIIHEGGANKAGIRGAADIASLIPAGITDVCVTIGTATTLNGLYSALPANTRLHGFYVAKDIERATSLIHHPASQERPTVIVHRVHDQRFGKWTEEAISEWNRGHGG